MVHQSGPGGATGQGLEPQGTRAGKQVETVAAGQMKVEPVEQGFPGTGGAGAYTADIRKAQFPAAPVASDNAQLTLASGGPGGFALGRSAFGHNRVPVSGGWRFSAGYLTGKCRPGLTRSHHLGVAVC